MTAPRSASVPTEKSLRRESSNHWTVETVLIERLGEKHQCLVEWSPSAVGRGEVGTVRFIFWTGGLNLPFDVANSLNADGLTS
jgi:hypothetical protein